MLCCNDKTHRTDFSLKKWFTNLPDLFRTSGCSRGILFSM